jgi:hypothetical protein
LSDEDNKANLSRKTIARKVLETALKPMQGVSSEAIRKNKVAECLKQIIKQQDSFALPKHTDFDFSQELEKVCSQIRR